MVIATTTSRVGGGGKRFAGEPTRRSMSSKKYKVLCTNYRQSPMCPVCLLHATRQPAVALAIISIRSDSKSVFPRPVGVDRRISRQGLSKFFCASPRSVGEGHSSQLVITLQKDDKKNGWIDSISAIIVAHKKIPTHTSDKYIIYSKALPSTMIRSSIAILIALVIMASSLSSSSALLFSPLLLKANLPAWGVAGTRTAVATHPRSEKSMRMPPTPDFSHDDDLMRYKHELLVDIYEKSLNRGFVGGQQ